MDSGYKSRRSFATPNVEAPLQVINGFNLIPKSEIKEANEDFLHDKTSPSYNRGATSPRSALQELLVKSPHQSKPATSFPSTNENLTSTLLKTNGQSQHISSISSSTQHSNNVNPVQSQCASAPSQILGSDVAKCCVQSQCGRSSPSGQWKHDHSSSAANQNVKVVCPEGKGRLKEVMDEKALSVEKSKKSSLFMFNVVASSSPADAADPYSPLDPRMDFLSSCHLCRRFLGVGQELFMYSGDKAFCSMECRYQQIVIDERKMKCPPAVIRSGANHHYNVTYNSKLTMASQYEHTGSSHYPINARAQFNTAAAA